MVRVRARPLGVAILAALDGLGCVVLVLFGLALAVAGPQVAQDPQFQQQIAQDFPGVLDPAFGPMLAALGLAAALLGVLLGVLAWGLWHGRGWAWTLAVGLTFLWLALGMVQIVALQDFSAIVGLGINGFVLWYFLQPGVKRWFGKVAAEAAMPGYVPPP